MDNTEIVKLIYPYTARALNCNLEKQKINWQRERLRQLLERKNQGEVVSFTPLHIPPDLLKLLL